MKDSRVGESLWQLWEGDGYTPAFPGTVVYYTYDHVDLEHEIVRKALASSIQRDGISFSLAQSFQMINTAVVSEGWVGTFEDSEEEYICSEDGESYSGDQLYNIKAVTFVEVPEFD